MVKDSSNLSHETSRNNKQDVNDGTGAIVEWCASQDPGSGEWTVKVCGNGAMPGAKVPGIFMPDPMTPSPAVTGESDPVGPDGKYVIEFKFSTPPTTDWEIIAFPGVEERTGIQPWDPPTNPKPCTSSFCT